MWFPDSLKKVRLSSDLGLTAQHLSSVYILKCLYAVHQNVVIVSGVSGEIRHAINPFPSFWFAIWDAFNQQIKQKVLRRLREVRPGKEGVLLQGL